jgi:hypothetical protein
MLFELTKAKQIPINEEDSQLAEEYLQAKKHKEQTAIAREARHAAKREEAKLGVV